MTSLPTSLWIATALCLAGLCAGLVLHLKWHPQRRHFSDAWAVMLTFPWLTLLSAAAWLFAGGGRMDAPSGAWSLNDLIAWRELAFPLLQFSLTIFAQLLHQLVPPWPAAFLLPVILSWLLWRVWRRPNACLKPPSGSLWWILLVGSVVATWTWFTLEIADATRTLPEWCESMRVSLRLACLATMTAACQVLIIQLAIEWCDPEQPEAGGDAARAVAHVASKWQSIFALAAFNLSWLLGRDAAVADAADWRAWLLPEFLLLFAALPIAVARTSGHFFDQGGCALRGLWLSLLPFLSVTITAVAVLMLVNYAAGVIAIGAAENAVAAMIFLPVHALVLATVHNWLFLAVVFTFLRYGFRTDAAPMGTD